VGEVAVQQAARVCWWRGAACSGGVACNGGVVLACSLYLVSVWPVVSV
jgi:hypothetical protein